MDANRRAITEQANRKVDGSGYKIENYGVRFYARGEDSTVGAPPEFETGFATVEEAIECALDM